MKNFMKVSLFSILMLFQLKLAVSQDIKTDLNRINQFYEQTDKLSFDISYKVYPNHYSTVPLESISGNYKKSGNNYYWEAGNQLMMQNHKYFISVDTENENILIGNPDKSFYVPYLNFPIDSVLKLCSRTASINLKNGDKRIVLTLGDPVDNITRIELRVNKDYFIHSIILFFDAVDVSLEETERIESARLEIKFSNLNRSPDLNGDIFKESRFFLINGDKVVPAGTYKNFQIIDQRLNR